jgi:preprotein translocase subunit SecF
MRFFHKTNIRFMENRHTWVGISIAAVLASLALILFGPGFKYGVDFAGGTQLTLRFKSEPDLARVRRALEPLGSVTIQRFDEAERHELLVRVQNPEGRQEGDFAAPMIAALDKEFNPEASKIRLNLQGVDSLRDALTEADPDKAGGTITDRQAHYAPMAAAILEQRKIIGVFGGPADLQAVTALSAGARSFLSESGRFGEFSLLAADNVGPLVGKDLRDKATLAVVFSLLGMLVYIWFRFKLQYGVGAIVALAHDTTICLGLLSLTGREIDIPTIAALLTLVGYSTNDTVIIFDRIREIEKLERGKSLFQVMNVAINATLSRTVITSGLTWMVVLTLYLFGGQVINTFAFVLLAGIIIGTYSSIYIASPFALWVSQWQEKRKMAKRLR